MWSNNRKFIELCENGKLEEAKQLYSLFNSNINISYKDDYAFRYACFNGHIEVAKWLLSLPKNIITINLDPSYKYDTIVKHKNNYEKYKLSKNKKFNLILISKLLNIKNNKNYRFFSMSKFITL